MSNLIEREKAIRAVAADLMANAILKSADASDNIQDWIPMAKDILSIVPTVDAVQVVHGHWIDETFAPWGLVHHPYKCDQCGDHSEAPSNYCPNCGAIMDGKDGDNHEG